MKLVPYKKYSVAPIGTLPMPDGGGVAVYAVISDVAEQYARYRYEWVNTMSRMRTAKIRWKPNKQDTDNNLLPGEASPYIRTGLGEVFLTEILRGWLR
jgi:hypothetical protein